MTKRKAKAPLRDLDAFPVTIETFRRPGLYEQRNLRRDHPCCVNGSVEVKRYRITIEEIPEPVEVVAARLQKMWDESDNHHEWSPLKAVAQRLGYELTGSPGSKREKRR